MLAVITAISLNAVACDKKGSESDSFLISNSEEMNEKQSQSSGEKQFEDLSNESQKFGKQYEITFVVDNNIYAKTSVSNCTIEKMPSDPKRENFIFKGWYFDDDQWGHPLTLQAILDLPLTENRIIKVYAYFIPYDCSIDGKEHIYIEESFSDATCTQNGIKTYVCSVCGYSYSKTIPALGHNYEKKIVKVATCTENGIIDFTCKNCGNTYEKTSDALGHNLGNLIITIPAKCKHNGEGYRQCSRCKKEIAEIIPQINHQLDDTKHCQNDGCDYFELFDCSVVVTSHFGTYTKNLFLEYGKEFSVSPEVYDVNQLKFLGYYNEGESVSDNKGNFAFAYQGQKSITVEAKYYYAVNEARDLINLQTNSFLNDYFANQKKGEYLFVEFEKDVDFSNIDWKTIELKGKKGVLHGFIAINGNNHIVKNYYSSNGGLFDRIQSAENIIFENVKVNITGLSKNISNGYYTLGLLSNYADSIENIFIKSGEITVVQRDDMDLGIAGICGQLKKATNCINRANITTNTVIASGIALISDDINNCVNYGNITTGEYIVSPSLITMGDYSYIGASGICNQVKRIKNCVNYGVVYSSRFGASGIALYTDDKVEECSNLGDITSAGANGAGVSVVAFFYDFFCNIRNCSNYGNVKGKKSAAGIACNSTFVESCYNIGNIESDEYAGGITANSAGLEEPIKYCYNIGKISGKGGCFGGVVGKANKSVLFKCVNIDNNFAADEHTENQCKVIGGTDECFIELGYDLSVWEFHGDGKPTLKWESENKE